MVECGEVEGDLCHLLLCDSRIDQQRPGVTFHDDGVALDAYTFMDQHPVRHASQHGASLLIGAFACTESYRLTRLGGGGIVQRPVSQTTSHGSARRGIHGPMTIEVHPAVRFEDVATMLGPKKSPDANVCWCLSYRLSSKENRSLVGPARGEKVRELIAEGPVGVLAYEDGEVVGWAAVAPRAETSFARNRKIPQIDDQAVWCVWCIRVRPGYRGRGISHHLLQGAVDLAREQGAPVIEGYPVDNRGEKVDLTMAYVGTRSLFEQAGFTKVADTDSVLDGFPRVLMRRVLE